MTVDAFIERWQSSGASEQGNATLFLSELCDLLGIDRPDPAGPDTRTNEYVFERRVDYPEQADRAHVYIDLYKRGCFVLEAKQGSDVPTETEGGLELDIQVGGDGAPAEPLDWPSGLKPRVQAVRAVMTHAEERLTVEQVAHFHRARQRNVQDLLETLEALGHVEGTDDGAYAT